VGPEVLSPLMELAFVGGRHSGPIVPHASAQARLPPRALWQPTFRRTTSGINFPRRSGARCKVARRAGWSLGVVEPASAFDIYYLPFVAPIKVDDAGIAAQLGEYLGPYTPLIIFAILVWIQLQINNFRREQEMKVVGAAAESAARSVSERISTIPPEQWVKLLLCVALDLAGDASYTIPGVGELSDVVFAPLEALVLRSFFGGTPIAFLGFAEEALPFSDALPTATIGWFLQTLIPDNPLSRLLGIEPLPADAPSKAPADAPSKAPADAPSKASTASKDRSEPAQTPNKK